MSFKTARGRSKLIGHGTTQPVPIPLDPVIYEGAVIYAEDGRVYSSNGVQWEILGLGFSGSQGFTGSQGPQGVNINFKGTVPTVEDLPEEGNLVNDAYIVEATNDLYVWDGTDWNNAGNIVGPKGDTGFTGSQGEVGFTGSQGMIGFTGSKGFIGSRGFTGSQGDIGFTGSQGFTGSSGENGGVGFTGSQGDIGFTGSQGIQGFTGSQGDQGFTGSSGTFSIVSDDTTTNLDSYFPVLSINTLSGALNNVAVSSTKLFYNPSTGTLSASNFNSLSDITAKENFEPIDGVHEILENINPISFTWKEDRTKSYGVIAQELERAMPELVTRHGDKKYVNYIPLIAILIEGYKDLSNRIKHLEKNK